MNDENKKSDFIEIPYLGKINVNERPMTKEEKIEFLLKWKIERDEDYQKLGLMFDEDE